MIGTPAFDPSTNTLPITGSTLALTSTGTQVTVKYDTTHYFTVKSLSTGQVDTDLFAPDVGTFRYSWYINNTIGRSEVLKYLSSQFYVIGDGAAFVIENGSLTAGYCRFAVSGGGGGTFGTGLSDGGAASTLGLCIGGTDYATLTSAKLVLRAATDLQLGNTAAAGTITADKTLIIKDATGTSYKVPCVAA